MGSSRPAREKQRKGPRLTHAIVQRACQRSACCSGQNPGEHACHPLLIQAKGAHPITSPTTACATCPAGVPVSCYVLVCMCLAADCVVRTAAAAPTLRVGGGDALGDVVVAVRDGHVLHHVTRVQDVRPGGGHLQVHCITRWRHLGWGLEERTPRAYRIVNASQIHSQMTPPHRIAEAAEHSQANSSRQQSPHAEQQATQ